MIDLTKTRPIIEAHQSLEIICERLGAGKHADQGIFHRFVTSVEEMTAYFNTLSQVVSDPAIYRSNKFYAFSAKKESQKALQKAEDLLGKFSREELVCFSDDAKGLARIPAYEYHMAVGNLFRYKKSTAPAGEWSRLDLLNDPTLEIFKRITLDLHTKYIGFKRKYEPVL